MGNGQQNRVGHFDVLRGIGIVLMIMGHVSFGAAFSKYIHAFHMPLFFFVSGYFHKGEKYVKSIDYIIQKAKTLLIPYTVFVCICQVLHYIYTGTYSSAYLFVSYFSSNHNRIDVAGAYWFLLCLFSAEIIFYFIQKLIFSEWTKLVVIVSVTLIGNFTPIKFPLCLDSAMSCMFIMYLGCLMRKYKTTKMVSNLLDVKSPLLVILFFINILLIFLNGNVNIRTNDYAIVPLFWISCIGAIVCYINLSIKIESAKNVFFIYFAKVLKYIGKNSLVYLVLNEMMIFFVNSILSFLGVDFMNSGEVLWYANKILTFTICMILLWISVEMFNRTKLKVLLGKF